MRKKIFTLTLLFCALVFSAPHDVFALEAKAYCSEAEKSSYVPVNERLQEVGILLTLYHCDTPKPSHILGTLHSDNHTIIRNAKNAFSILAQSKAAYFEIISDKKANLDIISRVLLPQSEPNNLVVILGDTLYSQVRALVLSYHDGFPDQVLERYRPWASTILMEYPEPQGDGAVLDELLQVHARKSHVPIYSLESIAEQFSTFEKLTRAQEVELVRSTVNHIDEIRTLNSDLEASYINNDVANIYRIGKQSFFEIEDESLRTIMQRGIIDQRNISLTEKMLPELLKGNRFVGIGVLHLYGKNGVLDRLEQQGFFVF
jgi:uncharacterized protein YbaP (TraB family)